MNTAKFEAMVKLVESNPDIKTALSGLTSVDEVVAILNQNGVDMTVEEFTEYMNALHSDEVPVELLEFVAGGGFKDWFQGFLDGLYDATIGLFNKR